MNVFYALWGEAVLELRPVEGLEVGRREGAELRAAEGGGDVQPGDPLVARVGRHLHAAPDRIFEPAPQVLFDGNAPGVVDEALVPLGYGLGELPSGLRLAFRVEDLAFAPGGSLDCIAGHPEAVLPSRNSALAVGTTLLSHRATPRAAPRGRSVR